MTTLKLQADAREKLVEDEKLKKRAARQAAKNLDAPKPQEMVECTVLPKGDGKISMGVHIAGVGEAFYEEDETVNIALPQALNLYDLGYVNFDNARALLKERDERRAKAAKRAVDDMDPDVRDASFTGAT